MGEQKEGSDPHIGTVVCIRGETLKTESETADLWQPKWNQNQTVLATTIHTTDRAAGPLEGISGWDMEFRGCEAIPE